MSQINFLRNSYIWWFVKVVSLVVQLFATWHVFMKEFSDRDPLEAKLVTISAILLIDVFFIASSYFIESDEMRWMDKIPFLIVNVLLAVFIMSIGIQNERNLLSFAPRIGIIGIVVADLIHFTSEVLENYFSREAVEQRLRNRQVKTRRSQDHEAWEKARKMLTAERIQLAVDRERKTLGLDRPETDQTEPISEEWQEVHPGIFLVAENQYAWVDKDKNFHHLSSTGKPYSLVGAKQAQTRSNGAYYQ